MKLPHKRGNKMKKLDLEIKIDLNEGEIWIWEKGTYNSCSYVIGSLNELGECVEDYIETYCKGDN